MSQWTHKDGRPYLRRSFFRTPSNGRVRILGEWFEPAREPLPERLWGTRALFHMYVDWGGYTGACHLWGSEAEVDGLEEHPGSFCEDGVFKWGWWRWCPTLRTNEIHTPPRPTGAQCIGPSPITLAPPEWKP